MPERRLWTTSELQAELDRFKAELRRAGLRESTIHAYLSGSSMFVRWLADDYAPGPGRARAGAGAGERQ